MIETLAFIFALAVMVGTHYLTQKRLEQIIESMAERDQERQQALYKQQKASERNVATAERTVLKLSDKVNALADETRSMHERVDRHFAHPAVKRLTDGS